MAVTQMNGPLLLGDRQPGDPAGANLGGVVLSQTLVLNANGTNAVSGTFFVPPNSQILRVTPDVLTAFNSAVSATLTVGTAAAGTQYAGGVDARTAGRAAPVFTAAQLLAMANTGNNLAVVATITPSGATSAGQVRVTIEYVQTTGI